MPIRSSLWCALSAVVLAAAPGSASGEIQLDADRERVLLQVKDELNLVDATLISIDIPNQRAQKPRLGITLDNVPLTIEVWEHSVRADNFEVRAYTGPNEFQVLDPGPIRTVRGRLVDIEGSKVAGSLDSSGLIAHIDAPDFGEYWIEPVSPALQPIDRNGGRLHVVYRAQDVIGRGGICGVVDGHVPDLDDQQVERNGSRGANCGGQVCKTEIAIDGDYPFVQSRFGDPVAAQQRIEDLMNLVAAQYEPEVFITYEITTILLRTTEAADPYSSTDAGTLLGQFRSHWNSQQGAINRDVAHLFTGRTIDGSTIGIAYVGVICSSSAYGLSQTPYNGATSCKASLVAHELGHNWNSPHCTCPTNTMNPSNTCYRTFTGGTRAIISDHRDSRGCLSAGSVPAPDAFSLLVPTNGRGNTGSSPTLQWQDVNRATQYHLLVDDNNDFSSPEVDLLTNERIVTVSGLNPARLYYWKVEASGLGGSTTSDEVFCFHTGNLSDDILCVDADAPPGGSGLSWASPLQSVAYAQEVGRCVTSTRIFEIRVAEGTYEVAAEGIELASGMKLLGGYAGFDAPDPDLRDPVAHRTVLSGNTSALRGAGGNRVITSTDDDAATLVDGFVIENGNAQDGLGGGGILMTNSSATVSNCIVRGCSSTDPGGAVRVSGGAPSFVNVLVHLNSASEGAAIYTDAPLSLTNATVYGNTSGSGGALGIDSGGDAGTVVVVNSAFAANAPASIAVSGAGSLGLSVSHSYVPEGQVGTGNRALPAQPNFVDAVGGDFTPGAGSALIDSGDESAPGLSGVTSDLSGSARIIDATNYTDGVAGVVDIGAYEAPAGTAPGAACEGDADGNGVVDVNDISYVLFRLGNAGPDGDADGNGTVDVNDISYVLFRLGNAC